MKKTKYIISVLLCSILLWVVSCSKFDELKSPVDGFNVILNYDVFETFISLRFIDAPTGKLIGALDDEKVQVSISGNGAGAVVDQLGNHDTIFNSVFGVISLALNPNEPWVPDEQNNLSLTFEAENKNYKSSEISFTIDSAGTYSFDVFMEKTNVERIGKKEYTHYLPLDQNGTIQSEYLFFSTENELKVLIPKGTRFINKNDKAVSGENIKVHITYYLTNNKAPVPSGLINNLKTINGSASKNAVDFYQIVEITFFDENGEEIMPEDHSIEMDIRFKNNYYNPLEKRKIQANDEISILTYSNENSIWEEAGKTNVLSDSIGFYAQTMYKNTPYISLANFVETCELNANFSFGFTNRFDELPVGVRINNYRKYDNRYIGSKVINVENENQIYNTTFTAIEGEETKFYVYNQSSLNPFSIDVSTFYTEQSCGNIEQPFSLLITSKRTQIDGVISITTDSEIPKEGIDFYADIYQGSNHSRMYREKIKLTSANQQFSLSTGILAEEDVYIKLNPVSSRYAVEQLPKIIPFNTSTGPFIWDFSISFKDISREFVFDFDIDESFENRTLTVRADFENIATNKVEKSTTFTISRSNPSVSKKLVIDENKSYRINVKRLAGKESFMAYPYSMGIGKKNQTTTFTSTLSPVNKQEVNARIKLLCGSSIIYPSLNGMYRTVWEDAWKQIKIKDGAFTQLFEIGGTYEIGTIFEGELVSTTYLIDETDIDLTMEMKGGICDSMGW